MPVPTREGYTFLGWFNANGEKLSGADLIDGTITVTARWEKNGPTADALAWTEELDVFAAFIIGESGAIGRNVPYEEYLDTDTVACEYEPNEIILIIASTTNYYGEKWYLTEEGDWIISTDGEIYYELAPFTLSEDTNYPDRIKLAYSSYKLTGTITSLGGNITTVNGGIFDLNGNRVYGKTVTVNAATFNIKTVDDAIAFRSLGVGEYYYRITVTNDYGTFDVIDYYFKVVATLPKYVTITFDANGGECDIDEMQVTFKGEIGELPIPEMDGYNFVGWYNELGDEITEFTIADMDMTIYALWEEKPIVKGDTDGDGMLDATDLLRMQQYVFGQIDFGTESEIDIDMNDDGSIDATDLVIMQMMILLLA